MSTALKKDADFEAGMVGLLWKQFFHGVPPIPEGTSLAGRTAVITGSNSGLGLHCARQFLELGLSRLIMGVRSKERGDAAAALLRSEFRDAMVDVWIVDMELYPSIQKFAARCENELPDLDIAILNAGLGKPNFTRCEATQHEIIVQVNYISTILLALLLLPKLCASKKHGPGRLSVIASDLAMWTTIQDSGQEGVIYRLDHIDPHKFSYVEHYGHAKLMLTILASKLAKLVSSDQIIINVVNPSLVMGTQIFREMKLPWWQLPFASLFTGIFGRNVVDGARIFVHSAVVLGKESHGSFTDHKIRPYPPYMYTDLCSRMTERIWTETLEELSFIGVDKILDGLSTV